MKRKNISSFFVWLFVFLCICTAVFLQNQKEYSYDEHAFVNKGYLFFKTFFLERDFFGEIWLQSMSCFGSGNPKAGMMILGAVYHICSVIGSVLGIDLIANLLTMRYINAVFPAFSVLFMFLFTSLCVRGRLKYIVIALLLINPVFRVVALSLTPDNHMLFFAMASLLVLGKVYESMEDVSFKILFLFSVLVGLSVSCRLYGFCVYLMFLFVCVACFRKNLSLKLIYRFLFVSFFSGFVFFITNPSFYGNFLFGFREMTIGHMQYLGTDWFNLKFYSLKYLFTYPYLIFSFNSFDIGPLPEAIMCKSDFIFMGIGYCLAVKGLLYCIFSKKYLPIFWFLASHLWVMYPFLVLGGAILSVKTLVLPMTSVVLLSSLAFCKRKNKE